MVNATLATVFYTLLLLFSMNVQAQPMVQSANPNSPFPPRDPPNYLEQNKPKTPPPPTAPSGKVLIDAKFMERDNEKDITLLRDNVQVVMDQNYISCNEAVIQWSKSQVVAVGNVVLKTPKSTIQADKIVYNMKEQKGQIYNGVIVSGNILLQGEYLEKIGEDTYKGEDTYLTACTTCPTSWSFTADKFEAEIEGYAYITNAWLRFVEVPTVYTPYFIIPLKNERQTGLLPITFELTQQSGLAFELPFFWAINRSQDLTITPKYYTKRGVQLLTNYRAQLSQNSGIDNAFGILPKDKRFQDKTRWFTNYTHFLELEDDYIQRTTLHLTSDTGYSIDFPQQFNYRGESALDNRSSLTKNFGSNHVSMDISYYLSMIEQNIDQSKENSVHRVPEIRFSISDKRILKEFPLYFRFDSQYVNFGRQGLGYDTRYSLIPTNPDYLAYHGQSSTGVFDPVNDKVRTGQRFDVLPYFYAPLRFFNNSINVTPYAGYRHTRYLLGASNEDVGYDSTPGRSYFLTGVSASTEFSRVYQGTTTRFRHSVLPQVSFQAIQGLNQTEHSFFGNQAQIPYFQQTQPLQDLDISDPNGRGLQFDYEDRVVGRRLVNFGLINKVVSKSHNVIGSRYDQNLNFTVSQAYDMEEAKKEKGYPWQDLRGLLDFRTGKVTNLTEVSYFPYHKVTNINSRLRTYIFKYNYVDLIYSNYINVPANPEDVNKNARQENLLIVGGIATKRTNLALMGEYSLRDSEFKRWTLSGQLIPPGDCWLIELSLWKLLDVPNGFGGTGNITFQFGS